MWGLGAGAGAGAAVAVAIAAVVVVVVVDMVLIVLGCFFKVVLVLCNCPERMTGTVVVNSGCLCAACGLHVVGSINKFLMVRLRSLASLIETGESG